MVQLVVDLRFFLRGQLATIGRAIVAHFFVDLRFILLQLRGFTGAQRAALHALRDTILLIVFALANRAGLSRTLFLVIALILLDLVRDPVLLLGDFFFLCSGQMAIVYLLHGALFTVEFIFLAFQFASLAGRKLSILYTVIDDVLLLVLTLLKDLACNFRGRPRSRVGALPHNWQRANRERCAQPCELASTIHS